MTIVTFRLSSQFYLVVVAVIKVHAISCMMIVQIIQLYSYFQIGNDARYAISLDYLPISIFEVIHQGQKVKDS